MADDVLARLKTIEQRLLRLEAAVYRPDLMPPRRRQRRPAGIRSGLGALSRPWRPDTAAA